MSDHSASNDDLLDAMIASGTALLGIDIEPAWQATIRANLAVSLRHATHVEGFALPDDAEPAPVFAA